MTLHAPQKALFQQNAFVMLFVIFLEIKQIDEVLEI